MANNTREWGGRLNHGGERPQIRKCCPASLKGRSDAVVFWFYFHYGIAVVESPPGAAMRITKAMQRLGKNNGRYEGERIQIRQILGEIGELADAAGWKRDPLIFENRSGASSNGPAL